MPYYLYVIKSGESKYTGVAEDLKERLRRHNAGENKSTKHCKNWKLVYFKKYGTLSEARREEARAKNLHHRDVAQPG